MTEKRHLMRKPYRALVRKRGLLQISKGLVWRLAETMVFYLSHVGRRDRRLWVFGNLKGFRDNPRYLAEHVANAHPEIRAWWVARNPAEAEQARGAGLSVAMYGTREAARVQRRAGAAFLSNALIDLRFSYLGGALIVHLYHGLGLKRILLDMDAAKLTRGGGPITKAMARLQRWSVMRRLRQVDLIMAAGAFAREHFATGFGLPRSRVLAIGTPRFDVIQGGAAYDRLVDGDLRARLGLAKTDHLVLWLPTWRERGDAPWLPVLGASDVDAALAGTDVVVLVKTHPYAEHDVFAERLPQHRRVRLLPESDVDVNCLLRIADVLVTDYSSAAFDYALLHRPIHFLAPDAEEFDRARGLYEPFAALTGGRHHTEWPSLLAALAAASHGADAEGMETARRVAALAGNNEEPGSCERITRLVANHVGIQLTDPATPTAGER